MIKQRGFYGGGADLFGGAPAPRPRGRPKGSTNKRAKDLGDYVAARFGSSAAVQVAAFCMVTPAELRQAGNSMAQARVNKAKQLRDIVRAEGEPITLAQALGLISAELAALMPYTDQRQPLAIHATGSGFQPAVIVLGIEPEPQHQALQALDTSFVDVTPRQVGSQKSEAEAEPLTPQGLDPP